MPPLKLRTIINMPEWSYCLGLLRNARGILLRDAESFHEAATALEDIGKTLSGNIRNGLSSYRPVLMDLLEIAGRDDLDETSRLFKVVCDARNMAVHEGAWARHLSSRLIDLLLILEEAIMTIMKLAEDVMVRGPIIAESWHMVTQVRREMLANSFSCLPVFHGEGWHILTDLAVMRFLGSYEGRKERSTWKISKVIQENPSILEPAVDCSPKDTIDQLRAKMTSLSLLVIDKNEDEPRLLGIITAFDLL